jgi:hypothetical protein
LQYMRPGLTAWMRCAQPKRPRPLLCMRHTASRQLALTLLRLLPVAGVIHGLPVLVHVQGGATVQLPVAYGAIVALFLVANTLPSAAAIEAPKVLAAMVPPFEVQVPQRPAVWPGLWTTSWQPGRGGMAFQPLGSRVANLCVLFEEPAKPCLQLL